MATAKSVGSSLLSVLFEYDTPKIVHIKSKKVGIINRFIQLCIIGYVIGYAIIFEKGYQDTQAVTGAVTTKVKGVARTFNLTGESERIWDVSDYVVPPQENNALFVITNLIITNEQKLGTCEEDNNIFGANCTDDPSICIKGEPLMTGDGFMTGECNTSSRYPGWKSCIVDAWCPTEDGSLKAPNPPSLATAENFTVFIKNNIEFPKFNVKRRNIPSDSNYLKSCRFDLGDNRHCPVFQFKTMVSAAGVDNFTGIAVEEYLNISLQDPVIYEQGSSILQRNILGVLTDVELKSCRYDQDDPKNRFCPIFLIRDILGYAGVSNFSTIGNEGGVIQIVIDWNCNLDHAVSECVPEYTFRRLDSSDEVLSKGYNFRYARYYKDTNGVESRTLFKAFGIKFIITLQGKAGKFDIVPLILNIGSGLALLSVATIVSDIIVLYVLKARYVYRESKYLQVEGDDAYKKFGEQPEDE